MKPITTPEMKVHQLSGGGISTGQIAAHLFILVAVTIIAHSVCGQADPKPFSFGNHGVEITFDSGWNNTKVDANQYEFLFGCPGNEDCPNILVDFHQKGIASIDRHIDQIEKKYRNNYPDLKTARSVITINGFVFKVVDFYIETALSFTWQTLIASTTESEEIVIFFNGGRQSSGKDQEAIYAKRRGQFFSMLQTITRAEQSEAQQNSTTKTAFGLVQWTLEQCNESAFYLVGRKDRTIIILPLPGKKARVNQGRLHMNGLSFMPFLTPIDEKQLGTDSRLSDSVALIRFVEELGQSVANLMAQEKIWRKPLYTAWYKYTVSPGRYGAVWFLTEHNMAVGYRNSNSRPKIFMGVVYATVPVGEYYFILKTDETRGNSLQEMEILLRRLMGSTRLVTLSELDGICSEKVPQSLVDNKP